MQQDAGIEIFFTVPEHPAVSLAEQYGWYEEVIRGQGHYVTKDHQGCAVIGPKRHRGHGWFPRKRKNGEAKEEKVVRRTWRERLKDREFHSAVQHTAVDITLWVTGMSLVAVVVKGAWWVLSL